METRIIHTTHPAPPMPPPETAASEKLASGVSSSSSEANVWQTLTFTPELRWGNDYMHARYYSPNLGRFLSLDPVGGEVGSSQSWNRYSYVLNNPVRLIDPSGAMVDEGGADKRMVVPATVPDYATLPDPEMAELVDQLAADAGVVIVAALSAAAIPISSTAAATADVAAKFEAAVKLGAVVAGSTSLVGTAFSGGDAHESFRAGLFGFSGSALTGGFMRIRAAWKAAAVHGTGSSILTTLLTTGQFTAPDGIGAAMNGIVAASTAGLGPVISGVAASLTDSSSQAVLEQAGPIQAIDASVNCHRSQFPAAFPLVASH